MVAIKIITSEGIKKDIVSESMTIQELCEKYGVENDRDITINEKQLSEEILDKSLRELEMTDSVEISININERKTAEIFVAGTCAVVKSGVKLDVWKRKMKVNQRVGIYDTNGDPIFMVAIEDGPGSLNSHGVIWSSIPTADGYACVTTILDPTEPDKIELTEAVMGEDLLKVIELERILIDPERRGNNEEIILKSKIRSV